MVKFVRIEKREEINKNNLEQFTRRIVKIIDPKIKEVLNLSVDQKRRELINYQMATGGKRLRPALAIASCLVCGGKIKNILHPAAGLEILHNYTLIVDDIIDNSELRRWQPTNLGNVVFNSLEIKQKSRFWAGFLLRVVFC